MKTVKLGICGLGTVAQGVLAVLQRNGEAITQRTGVHFEVTQVASRRLRDEVELGGAEFSTDLVGLAQHPDVDVVLELIGGTDTALEVVRTALQQGKHVVTANKALIAEHGNGLLELARANQVSLAFEAGVAGAIPVIKALREALAANRVESIAGIINGTGNFILTEMRKGRDFADVLAEAQALGYAEADPTFDVEGIDAAHKLTILAAVAFGIPFRFDAVFTEGISTLDTRDVAYAEELGYCIKHLGIAKQTDQGIELRVHPTLVHSDEMIAKVDGVMNAVKVVSDAAGETLYYGAGAGSEATASAVMADVIDVACAGAAALMPAAVDASPSQSPLAMAAVKSAYYLRMEARDHPGVLAKVATIMSERGINIESVMQKEAEQHHGLIPLIMLTHRVAEAQMASALEQIAALDDIVGEVVKIRVEPAR